MNLAASITFMLMAFLFPILIIFSLWYIYKSISTPQKSIAKKDKKKGDYKKKEQRDLPERITVLKCSNCSEPLEINTKTKKCAHCTTPYTLPVEYEEIFKYREAAAQKLEKADKFWRKARFFSSGFLSWFLLFMIFWYPISFFLILREPQIIEGWVGNFGNWAIHFLTFSIFSFIFWMLILLFSYGMVTSKRIRNLIPNLDLSHIDRNPEKVDCLTCGAGLEMKPNTLGVLCLYCETENYRKRFSWKLRDKTKEKHTETQDSLIEAIDNYKDAVDTAISTPVYLIFIFVILPVFMILIPMLIWNWMQSHILYTTLIILFIVICIGIFYALRRKK